ncbi:MAG: TolC family protein [Bacteroidota bacterium]
MHRIIFIFLTSSLFFCKACICQETMIDQVDQPFLDTLIALAKRNYPRIKAFQARTEASTHTVKAQKLSWFDPLTFSYVYQPNLAVNATNPVFLNGYQFGLFLNVGGYIQKPALIRKAKAELKAVENEEAEYNINLAAEVKKRYFFYLLQVNMLRVYTKSLFDAQGMLSDISIRYQKSELSFEDYSKALIVVNGNIQSKLETESNLLTAKSALEELTGIKLDEIKKDGTR